MLMQVFVRGIPRPQGSMTLARDPRTGREFAKYSGPTYEWRQTLHIALREWWGDRVPLAGPIGVEFTFALPRPKAHISAKGGLKPSAPTWHTGVFDLDKLCRAVNDGLTHAGVWVDDGHVAQMRAQKVYGDVPGVAIVVEVLP